MAFRPLAAPPTQPTSGFRPLTPPPAPQETGPKPFFGTFGRNLKQELDERTKRATEARSAFQKGEQGLPQTALQLTGGTVGAFITDPVVAAARSLPQPIKEPVKKGLAALLAPISKGVQAAGDKLGGTALFKEAAAAYPQEGSSPTERTISAIQDLANLAPAPKGADLAGDATQKAAAATVKGAGKATKGAASIASGVPRDVIDRAANPQYAEAIDRAIKHIAENEKQPFLEVATRVADNINKADTAAGQALSRAKANFKDVFPDAAFDVRPKIPQIVKALEPFRSSGLIVERQVDSAGKTLGHTVSKTIQSPFSTREIGALNRLMQKMRASGSVNIDDLLALRQSFSAAYDEIPLGNNKQPTPYHAAVMSMKADAERAINEILPPELMDAFSYYATIQDLKAAFGNRIIDGQGNLKPDAEQFFANIANTNKGALRAEIEKANDILGINIVDEVQAVKDAQKLTPIITPTGGRTQDAIRAILVGGLGLSGTGGPLGAVLALTAASPRVVGKVSTTIGKYLAKKNPPKPKAPQKLPGIFPDTPPFGPGSVEPLRRPLLPTVQPSGASPSKTLVNKVVDSKPLRASKPDTPPPFTEADFAPPSSDPLDSLSRSDRAAYKRDALEAQRLVREQQKLMKELADESTPAQLVDEMLRKGVKVTGQERTDAIETIGRGRYARLFRKSDTARSMDEWAAEASRLLGREVSTSDLRDLIVAELERRARKNS